MEEALHDMPLFREFAGLGGWDGRLPDERTILRFRHVLAPQILAVINDLLGAKGLMLRSGTVVDATLMRRRVRQKTSAGNAIPRCTGPKRAASGTSA